MNHSALVLFAALLIPLTARAEAGPADVLVTIDDLPISRKEVADRIWAKHADEELNSIVDELVLNKAVTAWRQKLSKKQKEAVSAEAEVRLKAIKSRFKDEAAFAEDLKKNGLQQAGLELQIRELVEREQMVAAANKLSVDPSEVRRFYDANKATLGGPPAVRLRHIVVAEERQAEQHLAALRAGADFSKLAAQVSIDGSTKDKGGDLGFITASVLPQNIQNEVMNLKPGEISEALRLPDGFHVFKAEERREPKTPAFPDIQKDLSRALLSRKIEAALPAYMAELRAAANIKPGSGAPKRTSTPN